MLGLIGVCESFEQCFVVLTCLKAGNFLIENNAKLLLTCVYVVWLLGKTLVHW